MLAFARRQELGDSSSRRDAEPMARVKSDESSPPAVGAQHDRLAAQRNHCSEEVAGLEGRARWQRHARAHRRKRILNAAYGNGRGRRVRSARWSGERGARSAVDGARRRFARAVGSVSRARPPIGKNPRFHVDVDGHSGGTRRHGDLRAHPMDRPIRALCRLPPRDAHRAETHVRIARHRAGEGLCGFIRRLRSDEQDDVARSKVRSLGSVAARSAFRHDVGLFEKLAPTGIGGSKEANVASVEKFRPFGFYEAGMTRQRLHVGIVRNSEFGLEVRRSVCRKLGTYGRTPAS